MPVEKIGEGVDLYLGDCLDVMKELPENSVDSIVTDPPYGLSFMGKNWDHGVPGEQFWREALRVAKPGAHLLAFGGTRTFHRLACAIEDAGWELRDSIGVPHESGDWGDCPWLLAWVYGSGFPKSKNVALAIDKEKGFPDRGHRIATASRFHPDGTFEPNGENIPAYEGKTEESRPWSGFGTALKPAWEPIIVARKPLAGTVAQNVLEHGTGAMNIDGCRVPTTDNLNGGATSSEKAVLAINGFDRPWMHDPAKLQEHQSKMKEHVAKSEALGRWPANLIHDGSDEVVKLFPNSKTSRNEKPCLEPEIRGHKWGTIQGNRGVRGYDEEGSAARFFYCAKADSLERHEGVGHPGNQFKHGVTLQKVLDTETRGNNHPTVKPVDLMKYLCRLVTPPHGVVMDPFMGSGSTGKAAAAEGFRFIGIEKGEEEFRIAEGRVRFAYAMVGWPGVEMEIDI